MAILAADLDFETTHLSLDELRRRLEGPTIVEYCSLMTRKLALLAAGEPQVMPEPVAFELPSSLFG